MDGSIVDVIVFAISAGIVLGGAVGVIWFANPVHNALSLIASFFGVAVLFVLQNAQFLAFVQVVVYAGAIVVLFLFVIMLLGVDKAADLEPDALPGQRSAGLVAGAVMFAVVLGGLFLSGPGGDDGAIALTGRESLTAPMVDVEVSYTGDSAIDEAAEEAAADNSITKQLARDLFTRNLLAFQATGLLLTIATIGAVVLVRNRGAEDLVVDEPGTSLR